MVKGMISQGIIEQRTLVNVKLLALSEKCSGEVIRLNDCPTYRQTRQVDQGLSKPAVMLLTYRHVLLQFFEPVERDVDLVWRCSARYGGTRQHDQELFAVRSHVKRAGQRA
jgi:hypothetical protein